MMTLWLRWCSEVFYILFIRPRIKKDADPQLVAEKASFSRHFVEQHLTNLVTQITSLSPMDIKPISFDRLDCYITSSEEILQLMFLFELFLLFLWWICSRMPFNLVLLANEGEYKSLNKEGNGKVSSRPTDLTSLKRIGPGG